MVPLAVRQAWKTMVTGRPGPVVLDVPFDVFMEAAAEEAPNAEGVERQYFEPLRRRSRRRRQGRRYAARRRAAGDFRRTGRASRRRRGELLQARRAPANSGGGVDERAWRHRLPIIRSRSGWWRAAATIRPTTPPGRPTCCCRSACVSTTAPRARGSRAIPSPFRRRSSSMSTSIRRRSAATIRWRSA